MEKGTPVQWVIPFPIERVIDSQARQAVANLARAQLITETEYVRVLEELGAIREEIELVRTLAGGKPSRCAPPVQRNI